MFANNVYVTSTYEAINEVVPMSVLPLVTERFLLHKD